MSDQPITRLLTQVGQLLGIPDLACDADGVCHLLIDARHWVQLAGHPRGYVILSCAIPQDGPADAELTTALARANFGQVAGGIVLCQGPDQRVYAQAAIPVAQADADLVCLHLDAVINEVERWSERPTSAPAPDAPAMRPPAVFGQTV